MSSHITPRRTYIFVYLALLILLGGTIGVAYVDLGIWNTVAAITIAVVKALLVVLFFMHVKYSSNLTRVYVLAGFLWLALLIGLTLTDYLTRTSGF
ncbi:MAG TPA: cytochrome C oxidase subunit IV family protein [Anaerolineales bacterium]|jgi:cytochrome c oxidase subunit 4